MMAHVALGFPTRTAAVLALRAQGVSDRAIAARLDIEVKTVSALAISAARTKRHSGGEPRPTQPGLHVPSDILSALRPHAVKRGISVSRLALAIIETAVLQDLVDAVLDDDGQAGRWA